MKLIDVITLVAVAILLLTTTFMIRNRMTGTDTELIQCRQELSMFQSYVDSRMETP